MENEPRLQPLDYYRPVPPARPYRRANDPESVRWRLIRFCYYLGLFALVSPVTFYFGPNLINFGQLTRLSPANFVPFVQQHCVPTVRAIKQYQQDQGRLPAKLDDLVPEYLPTQPSGIEEIENGTYRRWGDWNHTITYDFTPGAEGWRVRGHFANGPIPLPAVTAGPSSPPPEAP